MVWDSNPGRDKRFFSSQKYPDRLWVLPSLLFSGCCGSFSGVNRPGYEVQALPSSVEVKNEWSHMSCSEEFPHMTEQAGIVVTLLRF